MAKNGKNQRKTFDQMLTETGTKEVQAIRIQPRITTPQISRLERAIEGISSVKHQEICRVVRGAVTDYQRAEQTSPGSGLTQDFLLSLYHGIYDSLNFILHLTKEGGIQELRNHIGHRDYLPTMGPRVEFADALIDFAHTAVLQKKEGTPRTQRRVEYTGSELASWGTAKAAYLKAVALAGNGNDGTNSLFMKETKEAFSNAQPFNKATYHLLNRGINDLFPNKARHFLKI
ncbi:hypothetical protein HYU13_05395 [Candidatus Woesearchaeota archaeon]|nr:hypothetical protein [Candidatus Woesearchaeota archaeon]